MTPECWRQIEELYHLARERGPAVLADTDPELRREVERLLAQDSGGKILDRQPAELLVEMTLTETGGGAPMDLAGQTVSHYRIQELLGAGGMGVVYKAFDTKLNRLVALKFLPAHLRHDEELKKQLAEEARAASALDHPNIVVIYDIEEADDLFIAMAFHEGVTLREKMKTGLTVKEALEIGRQIAAGLSKAHENGIFHRDIKPGNVIVAKDGIARIIDFGLAKSSASTLTVGGGTRGTPLYMSPEQASGNTVDARTDLWSAGAVLFEMLTGNPPFRGETQAHVIYNVLNTDPPFNELRPDIPAGTTEIVARALQKDPAKRYQTAAEIDRDLTAILKAMETPSVRAGLRPIFVIPAAVMLLAALVAAVLIYQRSARRDWARQAIPEIVKLKNDSKPVAAVQLLRRAQEILPDDPQLAALADGLMHTVAVRSSPRGATVEVKDYLSADAPWLALGTTPIDAVKLPSGYLRWRVSKAGLGEHVSAPVVEDIRGYFPEFNFVLDAAAGAPEGMVPISAEKYFGIVWSLGDMGPFDLPAYWIDRFEVTNRQYQEFVDKGGYRERKYWKEKFQQDGKEISWDQAMELLRDSSGRPGPSAWVGGRYPDGQTDYPVGGVSWYEASAYAEFAGKSLPVIAQWYQAAPSGIAKYIQAQSNFSSAAAPVGRFAGLGAWGTFDMAGNVAEWCRNESGGGARYQLGGAWNTAASEYFQPGGQVPFHRAANAGFRCVRNTGPLPPETLRERKQTMRDFTKATPAPDPVFRVYKAMYSYDRTPLNAKIENVPQDSPHWRKEKITFDAAYGKERMAAYLFLPKGVKQPYQTVVFCPTARAMMTPSSDTLVDIKFIDFMILSGRAVLYPIYKGTYERAATWPGPDTVAGRDTLIQDSKDIGRSIDYLETRSDLDRNRIAFLGISMGASLGVIWTAVEERFKAVVMLDGGFYVEQPLPGADQADFAPRIKTPTLLIGGKFDWIFLGKDALMKLLGAPEADKKVVMLDTAHDVSERRDDLVREVLAWLDKYLGKVN